MAPTCVLVLRFGAAGDVVLISPALEALRTEWPHAKIFLATKEVYADLLRPNPHLTGVVGLKKNENISLYIKRLRDLKPDVIVDLHGQLRSRIVSTFINAPHKVRLRRRPFWQDFTVRLALQPFKPTQPFTGRYQEVLEKLLRKPVQLGKLQTFVQQNAKEVAIQKLKDANIDFNKPVVGLSPGASWPTKIWSAERFAELAQCILESGLQVVVFGSAQEISIANTILRLAPAAKSLAGQDSFALLPALISQCSAFVANDSGPMHIARSLGVPTLAIFGSTSSSQFDFTGHRAVFKNIECAPCHFHGRKKCPRKHFRCMEDLSVPEVWTALQSLLDNKKRALLSS